MKIFLWSLPIIIFTHELAHLVVAKLFKCGVEVFSVGFGKPALKKKIGETTYQITPWLLGGYCKLKGELDKTKDKKAFTNIRYRGKLAISLAGVTVNIIVGAISIAIGLKLLSFKWFMFGYYNLCAGITNLLPFPALDGSYPILVLGEKIFGKEKGLKYMSIIVKIGFIVIMVINILCIPLLIKYWKIIL